MKRLRKMFTRGEKAPKPSQPQSLPAQATNDGSIVSPNASHTQPMPSSQDPSPSLFPDGVKVLHECPNAVVDICFIHGLSGNRDSTWTALGQSIPWPKMLLPSALSGAHILTYGYDSKIVNKSKPSLNRLGDHAKNLLNDLTMERTACNSLSRPLIFVAHSLGGLICKEAILLSRNNPEDYLQNIFNTTKGIVFMGTPHKGAWLADWSKIPVSALGFVGSTNKYLLEVLETDNQLLENIQVRFWEMIRGLRESGRPFRVTCFFEELPLGRLGQIVSKESACLDGYNYFSIHADHTNMVKFGSDQDTGFKRLLAELIRWKSEVSKADVRGREDLETSRIEVNHSGQHILSPESNQNHQKSCHWITFPKNRHFVGRKTILNVMKEHLVDIKAAAPSEGRAFALWAPRGFGKTQTARRFVAETADHFQYILWVYADTETKILEAFDDYAKQLGLVKESSDFLATARALLRWFESLTVPFLVVFDNAESSKLINTWWPHGKAGAVLITTLDPAFATSTVAGTGAELPPLDESDAVEMVLSQVPLNAYGTLEESREAARQIVRRVANHPLAIQSCIGVINECGRSLSEYNRKYKDSDSVIRNSSVERVNRNYAPYDRGLRDALKDRVETLDNGSRVLMDVISILHPGKIPASLLDLDEPPEYLSNLEFIKDFDLHITKLLKGLVSRNVRKSGNEPLYFHVHTLLRDSLRSEMSLKSRQIAFETVTRLLCIALDPWSYPSDVPGRETDRRYFLEYFAHVESVRRFCDEHWRGEHLEALQVPTHYIILLSYSSWLCYSTGFLEDGLAHIKSADRILETLKRNSENLGSSQDSHDVTVALLDICHNHACITTELGDFSLSLELFQKEQAIYIDAVANGFQSPPGSGADWRISILGGIANSYQGLGNQIEAELYYKQCLELGEKNDIHSPYEVNICRSQWARGALVEASARLEELIALREAEYGPEDTEDFIIGHMKYVLGNVRIDQNRLDEAFELHKSALKCWRQTQEQHHKTGDAWHKVGWHYARLGCWNEARVALQSALEVYTSGKDEIFRQGEVGRTSYKLSEVFLAQGHEDLAAKMKKKARAIKQAILGNTTADNEEEDESMYDRLVSLWAR
ncbi:SesB protein [Nannizzia gypsea CBS 118893]|uniref:SesB protein n=1 Tax=Arthroderma gypseum (strain ATCC MYA-4604 / CBS 118893) TaxID=535722 RepID=E4V288_ARTGP|nr:SesB protein [Nannizzia gypsea CBS 118893]EFR04153.1 SesB protein [Nannizzia gypsea CBS 118893]